MPLPPAINPMQPIPEQIAPLGSHQFLDQLNLAMHREIALRLLADPEAVLSRARNNLSRWLAEYEAGDGGARCLEEWQHLLATHTVAELAAIITEDSDEGQRLRQSTPFVGILSSAERRELRDAYHRVAKAHYPEYLYSQS